MKKDALEWKTTLQRAQMSNSRAERMIRTIKQGVNLAFTRSDAPLPPVGNQVVFGNCRRKPAGQHFLFFLMYGVQPGLCVVDPTQLMIHSTKIFFCCFKSLAVQSHRAAKYPTKGQRILSNSKVIQYNVGDMVWVAKGKAIESMKIRAFQLQWYESCKIVAAKHPRYEHQTNNGKVSPEPIRACRLKAGYLRPTGGNKT